MHLLCKRNELERGCYIPLGLAFTLSLKVPADQHLIRTILLVRFSDVDGSFNKFEQIKKHVLFIQNILNAQLFKLMII